MIISPAILELEDVVEGGGGLGSRTSPRQLNEIQLLALLRPRHVRRNKRVHERLKVGSPPLCERVTNLPLIVHALAGELASDGGKPFVQTGLETFELAFVVVEVVAWPVHPSIPLASANPDGGRGRTA